MDLGGCLLPYKETFALFDGSVETLKNCIFLLLAWSRRDLEETKDKI